MAAPASPKAPPATVAPAAPAKEAPAPPVVDGNTPAKNSLQAARDRMAALDVKAAAEAEPEPPAPLREPGRHETYRAPHINARELMRSYANDRAVGRQRRLEALARKNPDVAALLKSRAPVSKKATA